MALFFSASPTFSSICSLHSVAICSDSFALFWDSFAFTSDSAAFSCESLALSCASEAAIDAFLADSSNCFTLSAVVLAFSTRPNVSAHRSDAFSTLSAVFLLFSFADSKEFSIAVLYSSMVLAQPSTKFLFSCTLSVLFLHFSAAFKVSFFDCDISLSICSIFSFVSSILCSIFSDS